MVYAIHQRYIVDLAGNVVPNAAIEIRHMTPGFPLATVFSDREGNDIYFPVQADANGFFEIFAPGGVYRITATSGAFSRSWDYVAIGTAAEKDGGTIVPFDAAEDGDVNADIPDKAVTTNVFNEPLRPYTVNPTTTLTPNLDNSRKIDVNVSQNLLINLPINGFVGLDYVMYLTVTNSSDPVVTFGPGYYTAGGEALDIPTDEGATCRVHCDVRSVDSAGNPDVVWISLAGSNFEELPS